MEGAILRSRAKLIALVLPVAFTIGFIDSWNAAAGILLIILGVPALGLVFATGVAAALVQDARADEARRSRLQRAVATLLIAGLATGLFLPAGWLGGYTGLRSMHGPIRRSLLIYASIPIKWRGSSVATASD